MTARLIYIDDSGSEQTAVTVFGWVELALPHWNDALRGWLDWRHGLYRSVGIPADYELHSTRFVGGRGRPTGTGWDEVKSNRSVVMGEALHTIAALPGLCVGAAYQRTQPGVGHHVSKVDTYARLVRHLDSRLNAAGEFGLIVMDGDGTDPTYRAAHRALKLAARSLIEDPLFQNSHHSQWVQMADIVAYTAYMRLARIRAKAHTWGWYDILATAAITGEEPLDLSRNG